MLDWRILSIMLVIFLITTFSMKQIQKRVASDSYVPAIGYGVGVILMIIVYNLLQGVL